MRVWALSLAALLAPVFPADAIPAKLPPVDESKAVPAVAALRARLQQAVAKRDGKALAAMLAPDVLVNFGGESGPKAFVETWGLNAPATSDLWPLLTKMLKLGCAESDGNYVIPSLTMQFDPDEAEDLFDKFVVVSPGAKLRSGPDPASSPKATLAWDVVKAVDQSNAKQTKVRLQDGREGWMSADDLYNPAYYRMILEKRDGKWMIAAFVAGD